MIVACAPKSIPESTAPESVSSSASDTPPASGPGSFLEAMESLSRTQKKDAAETAAKTQSTTAPTSETEESTEVKDTSDDENSETAEALLAVLVAESPSQFLRVPLSAMTSGGSTTTANDTSEETSAVDSASTSASPGSSATTPLPLAAALPNAAWRGPQNTAEWLAFLMPQTSDNAPDAPKTSEGTNPPALISGEQLALLGLEPVTDTAPETPGSKLSAKGVPEIQTTQSVAPTTMTAKPPAVELASTNATPSTTESVLKALDTVQVQAVRNVRYLVDRNGHVMSVRLVPESLGELHIQVQTRGDEMTVRLVSSNPLVRDALEDQMAGLRQALTRPGGPVPEVQVAAHMGQSFSPGGDTRQDQGQGGSATRYDPTPPVDAATGAGKSSPKERQGQDGSLNLLV